MGYTVKKHDIAYFGSLKFIFSPEKIPALKKSFEKSDLLRLILSRSKHEGTFKKPVKKRAIRQLVHPTGELSAKEIQQIEGAQPKESVLPPALPNQGEPLQVEEIDKKLEEILGQ